MDNQSCSTSNRDKRVAFQFETLEPRHMMAANVTSEVIERRLAVRGSDLADTIDVRQQGDQIVVGHATREGGRIVSMGHSSFYASSIDEIVVFGGKGDDSIRFSNPSTANRFQVFLDGGEGSNSIESVRSDAVLVSGQGNNKLSGRNGIITIDYRSADHGIRSDLLRNVTTINDTSISDRLRGISNVIGSNFSDTISGSRAQNIIEGLGGDDHLTAFQGRSLLSGGDGNDTLVGGGRDDSLMGGQGNDVIHGGDGRDNIDAGDGDDLVQAGDGDDYVDAGEGDDSVEGGLGNDQLVGANGKDRLNGGDGSDFLDGGDEDDTIMGGKEFDVLKGAAGNDLLNGEEGDDLILGGEGQDTLNGADGRDTILGGGGTDETSNGNGDGTASRSLTQGTVSSSSGLVQFIDDANVPNITFDADDGKALKQWLSDKYQLNKVAGEAIITRAKVDRSQINKIKNAAISRDESIGGAQNKAETASNNLEKVKQDILAIQAASKDASSDRITQLAKQLQDLQKTINDETALAEQGLALGGFLGSIGGKISDSYKKAKERFEKAASDFAAGATELSKEAAESIIKALKNGEAFAKAFVNDVRDLADTSISALSDALVEAKNEIQDTFNATIQGLKDFGVAFNQTASEIASKLEVSWTKIVENDLLTFPVLQGNGVDFFKGLVESPQRFSDWWNEKVEVPFNNFWQNELEPWWHDREDAWHSWWDHVKGFDYRVWKFVIDDGSARGPVFSDGRTNTQYDRFRDQLLNTSLKLPVPGVSGQYEDTDLIDLDTGNDEDHAFKNGMALTALAIEGENREVEKLLKAFLKYGFDETGEPVRLIPYREKYLGNAEYVQKLHREYVFSDGGGADNYSIDQFVTQLTGIHFAWKHGDAGVRTAAKALMQKWVQVLQDNRGRLGPDQGINNNQFDQTLGPGQSPVTDVFFGSTLLPYLVSSVAEEMGLSYNLPAQVAEPIEMTVNSIKDMLQTWIYDALGKLSWKPQNPLVGSTLRLPANFRQTLAELAVSPISDHDDLLLLGKFFDKALQEVTFSFDALNWRGDVRNFLQSIVPFTEIQDINQFSAVASGYLAVNAYYSVGNATSKADLASLSFWQAMLYEEFHPIASIILQPLKAGAQAATAQHRWLTYDLLAGLFNEPVNRLKEWPEEWLKESYMFKVNRAEQDETFASPLKTPRLNLDGIGEPTDEEFAEVDINHDRQVSKSEFLVATPDLGTQTRDNLYRANDRNLDGVISAKDRYSPQLGYVVLHALGRHFGAVK